MMVHLGNFTAFKLNIIILDVRICVHILVHLNMLLYTSMLHTLLNYNKEENDYFILEYLLSKYMRLHTCYLYINICIYEVYTLELFVN